MPLLGAAGLREETLKTAAQSGPGHHNRNPRGLPFVVGGSRCITEVRAVVQPTAVHPHPVPPCSMAHCPTPSTMSATPSAPASPAAPSRMLPLGQWPAPARGALVGVFTDIDDTLTTDGAITPDALAALRALKAAGLHVIPITGRPVGWSEPMARAWPVDAIVAENGSVALTLRKKGLEPLSNNNRPLLKLYQQDAATRTDNYTRMQQVAHRVLREVPGATLARDSAGRETDIAIDHSEFAHLPPVQIAQVVAVMQREGMTATVSSIHINGW